ncbi:MAG: hypothetical protein MZV64_62875 [Ignavibacteriales bacterium]|nr:hypothetical protein [Ignavibacteriales bacterium]
MGFREASQRGRTHAIPRWDNHPQEKSHPARETFQGALIPQRGLWRVFAKHPQRGRTHTIPRWDNHPQEKSLPRGDFSGA